MIRYPLFISLGSLPQFLPLKIPLTRWEQEVKRGTKREMNAKKFQNLCRNTQILELYDAKNVVVFISDNSNPSRRARNEG